MSVNLDIIIPFYNEAENLQALVKRIHTTLTQADITFNIIAVDDNSTDKSVQILKRLAKKFPVTILTKTGQKGKAFSILEGAKVSSAPYIAMIDADLQYPPEVLPDMFRLTQQYGVVVARRQDFQAPRVRQIMSRGFQYLFGKLLYGLDCDIQSGLKVFKRDIIENVHETEVTAWTLDIPLLTTALDLGYKIGQVAITFAKRTRGESKINLITSIREIGGQAISYRMRRKDPFMISPQDESTMVGAGLIHRGKKFVTHTTLETKYSALHVITAAQKLSLLAILFTLTIGLIFTPFTALKIFVAILSTIYFIDVVFNLFVLIKSLHNPPEIQIPKAETDLLQDKDLPIYTIMCPLYKEAHVLPQFVENISKMDWPKSKMDVMLLLEADDLVTIEAAKAMNLPEYISIRVVPDSQPKTKPKACNYGLHFAKGEYLVIYDAEDDPDPLQLKKVYAAFQKSAANVKCIQAKLNFYNPHQNLLTRFFTAEYSLWFDVVLTGLQSINTTIPLGGTSNHFRTEDLKELQGWDPFNVTEDCDLGIRLFKRGALTAVIDSVTLEEANSNWGNWLRQRSRWIKGYMQTYLVHMRNPVRFAKEYGWHSLMFQLVVGGKIAFMLINPFMWLLTISYFALYAWLGPAIEALYPSVVFYMAITSLLFGNFMFIYYYMIGAAKREHWYVIKWVFLVPIYWLLVSVAAGIALYELVRKPHYWQKTVHGLHLKKLEVEKQVSNATKSVVAEVAVNAEVAQLNLAQKGIRNTLEMFRVEKSGAVIERFITLRKKLNRVTVRKSIAILSKPAYWGGVLLIGATLLANVTNMATNLYLGKSVDLATFGLFSVTMSIFNLASIPVNALGSTINYKASYLFGKHGQSSLRHFVTYMHNRAIALSLIYVGVWFIFIPWLSHLFALNSYIPFMIFSIIWVANLSYAVSASYLSARLAFASVAVLVIAQPIIRLLSAATLVHVYPFYTFLSIAIGLTAVAVVGWVMARKGVDTFAAPHEYHLPRTMFVNSLLAGLSTIAFFSLDTLIISHFVTPLEVGQYALLGLFGKMVFFIGSLASPFLAPLVARRDGSGQNSQSVFNITLLSVIALTAAGYVGFIGGGVFFGQFLFGDKIDAIRTLLPEYGVGIAAFTVAQVFVNYHVVKKHTVFPITALILAGVQTICLAIWNSQLSDITHVMSIIGITHLIIFTILHLMYPRMKIPMHNLQDFLDLLKISKKPVALPEKSKLRVLILNWRDTKHTWAGGAELYIHELAKELVQRGHQVTVFSGNDGHCARTEKLAGYTVIRRGGFYMVYFWAALYLLFKFRGNYDVIIDSENGIPFLSPIFSLGTPVTLLIHHVHQDVFRKHLKFPLQQIAMAIEGVIMPLVYRGKQVLVVSPSTQTEVFALGITDPENITIAYPGTRIKQTALVKKTTYPSICYVGRLQPYKNVDIAIKAFDETLKSNPTAKFTIAGSGMALTELKRLVKKLKIESSVKFVGKISDRMKTKLYASSWFAVQPSSIEGWGITVIEANTQGTPVIASNVSGLRDSVVDGKTGILVPPRDVEALARTLTRTLASSQKQAQMSKAAIRWSQQFTWEKSTEVVENILYSSRLKNWNAESIEAAYKGENL